MSTDPLARPLGRIERFYWLLDRQACTNFVLSAALAPGMPRAALEDALARSWTRHPRLRCRIAVDPAGTVVLEPEAGGPPAVTPHPGPWRALADAELVHAFPLGAQPLIRCHWCEEPAGPVALFTFEHGLLDAGSAAAWVLELLADACGAPPASPFPAVPEPSDARYPRRLRGLWGLGSLLRMIFVDGLLDALRGQPRALPAAPTWGTPRRPATRQLSLDPRRTEALILRCRALGCTVQGALMAAQLTALRGEHPGEGPLPLGAAAAMDLRPHLEPPIPAGALGNHVSLLSITERLTPGADPAPLAVALSARLRGKIARDAGPLFWRLLPPAWWLPPDARSVPRLDRLMRATPPSAVVTNLGRLPDPPQALQASLRALRFTMAPQPGSPLCTAALTHAGGLHLDLCFDGAHLDDAAQDRVTARFAATLEALAGE